MRPVEDVIPGNDERIIGLRRHVGEHGPQGDIVAMDIADYRDSHRSGHESLS